MLFHIKGFCLEYQQVRRTSVLGQQLICLLAVIEKQSYDFIILLAFVENNPQSRLFSDEFSSNMKENKVWF